MTSSAERRFIVFTFCAYALTTLWVVLHHEPWADEAQSWLLMRDGGVATMLARTGYEGIPALFYLAIAPFASAGFPILSQALVNLAFAWGAVLLLLVHAPFPRVLKVLLVFSYYLAYEFAVLARPYALTALLMFAVASSWNARDEHPWRFAVLLALLANSTAHGLIIAAVLAVCAASLRAWRTWLVTAGGFVLCAVQLRVPPDGPHVFRHIDPQTLPYSIGSAFLPGADLQIAFVIGVCVVIAILAALHRDRRALLFMVSAWSLLLLLFVFIWMGGLRHAGLLLLISVTALWIARPDPRGSVVAQAALAVTLVWSVIVAAQNWVADTNGAYSGGQEMGRYIATHNLQRFEIAVHPMNETKSVFAFVPGKKFWFAASRRYGTYSEWGTQFDRESRTPLRTAIDNGSREFAGKPWLLLTNAPVTRPGLTLLYENREPIYARPTEHFYLYQCAF